MTQGHDPTEHLWWLGSRALGVAAIVLIALSVGMGLALGGRMRPGPGGSALLRRVHEAIALSGLIAVAGHGVLLLGDPFLRPGLAGILLPFQMAQQPVWTGVGIVAGWLAAIVGLSFYVRKQIGAKVWRWLHRWTLAVYVLSLIHTIGSGTDARSTWLIAVLVLTPLPIVFATAYRALPAEPKPKPAPR